MKSLILLSLLSGCAVPPAYEMPPIPKRVHIDIQGDVVQADEGGELLLRHYVAARKLLKPAGQ